MSSFKFSPADLKQIEEHQLSLETIQKQLSRFETGFPLIDLVRPATIGNGIIQITPEEEKRYISLFEGSSIKSIKFVPASGAASRMFRILHEFEDNYKAESDSLQKFLADPQHKNLQTLYNKMEQLPFYHKVVAHLKTSRPSYDFTDKEQLFCDFIDAVLNDLDYDFLPKGLIPFHHYAYKTASAFEEHLFEGKAYATEGPVAHLHFTVSPEHLDLFKSTYQQIKSRIQPTEIALEVTYSFQESSTDTIAVDHDNKPFRDPEGRLVLRPGGHGSLIQNLNKLEGDLVFIKNIDNVLPDDKLGYIAHYKKALAGLLLHLQGKIFDLLHRLDQEGMSADIIQEANHIAQHHFSFETTLETEKRIRSFFNRPLRICGMVENESSPGGGPFWVRDKDGRVTLQIVEDAQIDSSQAAIVKEARHFNPTDLVCSLKNYRGEKFDLPQYINPDHGFITHKFMHGIPLKALEHPGLWNGSMANWNTLFVEVPAQTFNPVKTVLDLLNPAHQVKEV